MDAALYEETREFLKGLEEERMDEEGRGTGSSSEASGGGEDMRLIVTRMERISGELMTLESACRSLRMELEGWISKFKDR